MKYRNIYHQWIKYINNIKLNIINTFIPPIVFLLGCILLSVSISGCAFKCVSRSKNIVYLPADSTVKRPAQELNVFAPRKHADSKEVLLFIHGGTWNSGNKSMYNFLGNRMARKDVVTVIIDYPKSPAANFNEMAKDAAIAVKWVKENIKSYGGDPDKIFISGHSAGGHLAALITVRNEYFDSLNMESPLKGGILIDAAGLDIYSFMKDGDFLGDNTFLQTFTADSAIWKEASPIYHLHKDMPPMLIYVGGKTYPSIRESNEKLVTELKALDYNPGFQVLKKKKHKPMITQFLNSCSRRYDEIIDFMRGEKK